MCCLWMRNRLWTAHRALRRRPDDTEPPRALVVRLHYFRDVTTVLRRAASLKDLFYHGLRIRIFPHFIPEVAKRRAAFNRARELLRDKRYGIRYGLLYPAKLRVTFRGKETVFTGAKKAREFTEHHFGAGREDADDPTADIGAGAGAEWLDLGGKIDYSKAWTLL